MMTMRLALAALVVLAAALHGGAATAQVAAPAPCPAAADLEAPQMLGAWHAEVEGQAAAPVVFEPNVNHPGSLSGTIDRPTGRSRIAADLDDGEFTMEESSDGVHIAATWLGEVVPDTCGKEIRGSWTPEGGTAKGFVLHRAAR